MRWSHGNGDDGSGMGRGQSGDSELVERQKLVTRPVLRRSRSVKQSSPVLRAENRNSVPTLMYTPMELLALAIGEC